MYRKAGGAISPSICGHIPFHRAAVGNYCRMPDGRKSLSSFLQRDEMLGPLPVERREKGS